MWKPPHWVGWFVWFFFSTYSQGHAFLIYLVSFLLLRNTKQELRSLQIKDATQLQFSPLCLFSLSYTISQLQASPSQKSLFHSVTYVEGLGEKFNRISQSSEWPHPYLTAQMVSHTQEKSLRKGYSACLDVSKSFTNISSYTSSSTFLIIPYIEIYRNILLI